jgi:hypothetical protein
MTSYSLWKFQNTELHSLSAVCLPFLPSSFTSTWRSHPTRPFQPPVFILLLGNLTQSPTNFSIQFQLILTLLFSLFPFQCFHQNLLRIETPIFTCAHFLNFILLIQFHHFVSFFIHHFQFQVLLERLQFHLM